jgi:mono/diheme cytochrome c family protein
VLKRVVNVVEVIAIAGFALFVVLLLVAQPESTKAASTSGNGNAAVDGAALFADNCARCHGAKGDGGVGSKLSGGAVTSDFKDADAELIVVRGGRGGMPAFEHKLSPEQLQAVVDYTRTDLQQR